ncbi:MAG: hypothetical protein ACE148_00060 [Vicinamibacterales bacterium]
MTNAAAVDAIDRLEEKIRLLVSLLEQARAEQARMTEDNQRLVRQVEALQAKVSDAEDAVAETAALREERDQIRQRVAGMLAQLDALNL